MSDAPRPDSATACRLLHEYFLSRTDIVAARQSWIDRKTKERITQPRPVTGDAHLNALISFHVAGPDPSKAPALNYINRKTNGLVADKRGFDRVGSYIVAPDNTTICLCFDFDGPGHPLPLSDPLATMLACMERCRALGIPVHIEKSGSGHGWHLWVFFDSPVPAADARLLAHFVAPTGHVLVSGEDADIRAGRGIECFPKQNSVSDKPFRAGNMVWLPFWYGAKDGGNQFHRITEDGGLVPYAPEGFERLAVARLQDILTQVPDDIRRFVLKTKSGLKEPSAPKSSPPAAPSNFAPTDSQLIQAALDHISPDVPYDDWLRIGMALHHWDPQAGLAIWEAWSARGEKYVAGEPSLKWDGFTCGGGVTLGTLFDLAKKAGWEAPVHAHAPLPTDEEIAAFMDIDPAALPVTSTASTPERAEILRCLTESREPLSPKEIAERLQKDYWAVQKTLNRMSKSGQIEKFGHGKYRVLDAAPVQMDDLDTRTPVQLDTSPVQMGDLDTQNTPRLSNLDTSDDRPRLPVIVVNNRHFRHIRDEAWEAVQASNYPPRLFQRTGSPVCLTLIKGVPEITPVDSTIMFDHLCSIASWVRRTTEMEVPSCPPKELPLVMVKRPSSVLPSLESVTTTPTFDQDGSLVQAPGYNREARLWMHRLPGFDIDDVPTHPSRAQIDAARSLLLNDLLVDFPFTAISDRAHAVAALLLPFVRRMIQGPTPLHLMESPSAGTGKTLLGKIISLIAQNKRAEISTIETDERENSKKITAILSISPQVVLFDNIRDGLKSSMLAAALTSEIWCERLLGASQMLRLPNLPLWIATANNPPLTMEIARRCVRIRLDSRVDRPWLRDGFKHIPLDDWVTENRAALIHAMLTLVRAWVAAGKPEGKHTIGSFESWARVIGGILDVADIPGFLCDIEELYEIADAEGGEWREFVAAWWDKFRARHVISADLLELADQKNLIASVIGDKGPRSQKIRLGRALGTVRDRQFDSYRISVRRNQHSKQLEYALEETDGSGRKPARVISLVAGGEPSKSTLPAHYPHEIDQQNQGAAGTAGTAGNNPLQAPPAHAGGGRSHTTRNYPNYPQAPSCDLADFDPDDSESNTPKEHTDEK